jgi:hypothetical protein
MSREPIDSYLADLRRRLRWRRGRTRLSEEIEDHLREMTRAELARGVDQTEAQRRAVEQMGAASAVAPGRRLGLAIALAGLVAVAAIGGLALRHLEAGSPSAHVRLSAESRLVAREIAVIDTRMTRGFVRVSLRRLERTAQVPLFLPEEPSASDHRLDSVWSRYGRGKAVMLVYRSGLVEQLTRWRIRGRSPASVLHEMVREERRSHARFARIGGAPAEIIPPDVHPPPLLGFAPPMWQFGIPATVMIVRDNTVITLQRWGRHTLPSVLRAAHALRARNTSFRASPVVYTTWHERPTSPRPAWPACTTRWQPMWQTVSCPG